MLDGRFYRYGLRHLKNAQKGKELQTTMLGQAQLEWLISMLKKSTAKFKVLASGTMWHDLADKGGRDSWASEHFRHERELIFNTIDQNKINGVILISGDRHRTDIWKTERPNGYPLFEFLSAKLTNVHRHNDRKEALWSHRAHNGIDGLTETFWGQLDFDTTLSDPTVTFKAINMNQKLLKSYSLKLSQLSHSK
jgi:alkaline phosphatase D